MSVYEVPLYQPEDTKILRLTLTDEEWTSLTVRCLDTELTLEQYINDIVRDAARKV